MSARLRLFGALAAKIVPIFVVVAQVLEVVADVCS